MARNDGAFLERVESPPLCAYVNHIVVTQNMRDHVLDRIDSCLASFLIVAKQAAAGVRAFRVVCKTNPDQAFVNKRWPKWTNLQFREP